MTKVSEINMILYEITRYRLKRNKNEGERFTDYRNSAYIITVLKKFLSTTVSHGQAVSFFFSPINHRISAQNRTLSF